jgi:AcrR family transcriptional regulator
MPSMSSTAVRLSAPVRRRRILDAAVTAFADRGYDAASVKQIASAAGITKPVLYDHFASKRRLFEEAIEGIRDELIARSADVMAREAPIEERIRAAVDAFFAYVEERPAAARVLLVTPRGEPELAGVSRRVQAEATAGIAALLAAAPELLPGARDRERRLELMTEFLKQGMHGLAEWWADHPETPRKPLVDAVMDVAWTGLRGSSA